MKKAIKTINHKPAPELDNGDESALRAALHGMVLERCMEMIRDDWSDLSPRERISLIQAITMSEVRQIKLREDTNVPGTSGVAVKRYEAAFAANAARKRRAVSGSAATDDIPLLDVVDGDELEY